MRNFALFFQEKHDHLRDASLNDIDDNIAKIIREKEQEIDEIARIIGDRNERQRLYETLYTI